MSITPEQRDDWVAALRSGQYRQGRDLLFYVAYPVHEQYSCLGVLGVAVLGLSDSDMIGHAQLSSLGHNELPRKVQARLAELNDAGVTFEQIADLLENAGDPALWA